MSVRLRGCARSSPGTDEEKQQHVEMMANEYAYSRTLLNGTMRALSDD